MPTPSTAGMPHLLYGTAWKEQRTAALVQQALQAGFRGIDTACQPKHYNEPGVGEGIAAFLRSQEASAVRRADLYLQTKFTSLAGQDPKRIPYDARAPLPEQVAQSVQVSLHNLGVDYLDGLVLHSPLTDLKSTLTVWRAMEHAQESGLVRALGISNCYEPALFAELCQHAHIQPTVLQNRFYAKTHYDRELRAFCRERQITYQTFWTLSANRHLLEHKSFRMLSRKHNCTPAQLLFRYLTHEGAVPLTGTQSLEHMHQALAIFGFSLDAAERSAITALL